MGLREAFTHPLVTIYHGDCRDLRAIDLIADLIVTDPPYGVSWQSNRRRREGKLDAIEGDTSVDMAIEGLGAALTRLRRGRHVYAFGRYDWSTLPLCEAVEIVWDRQLIGTGNLYSVWGPQHDIIQFAVYEISKANREKGFGRLAARLRRGSVIREQRKNSAQVSRHPAEKPVGVLRQLIEASSCLGEIVLDPFAGIGSTLVAALLEGRRSVGVEVRETYVDIAVERVRTTLAAMDHLAGVT